MTIKATQDGEVLQTVISDENGEGVFENLTIGTYYVDGISSDETLYNNNMITTISDDSTNIHNYVLHP